MRSLLLLLAWQSALCSQESAMQGPSRRLELLVTDAYGKPMVPKGIGLIHLASRENFASKLVGLTVTGLPHGLFWVRIWSPGYKPTDRFVNVAGPLTRARVGVPRMAGTFSDVSPPLRGVLRGKVPLSDRLWVRLIGVFVPISEDCPVGEDDSFEFPKVPGGKYVIVGISGNMVIATKSIVVSDGVQERPTVELRVDDGGQPDSTP